MIVSFVSVDVCSSSLRNKAFSDCDNYLGKKQIDEVQEKSFNEFLEQTVVINHNTSPIVMLFTSV